MLVEDEVHLLDVMRKLLKADGSETYLAVNKNQLFDLAIANRPGQVVSYSMMLG
jgi:DNA-binding response OmpR family regulator